jgi:hypothetical protein
MFLLWLVDEYPDCAGRNITIHDIESEFFPRFKVAGDCRNLQLGTLLRGLRNVRQAGYYTDRTGRRRSVTVYWVPKAAATVEDLAAAKRGRGGIAANRGAPELKPIADLPATDP